MLNKLRRSLSNISEYHTHTYISGIICFIVFISTAIAFMLATYPKVMAAFFLVLTVGTMGNFFRLLYKGYKNEE